MLEPVARAMQDFVDRKEVAGVVSLVVHRGKQVHLHACGMADLAANRPQKTDDVFWIASMTKPMTAACVMMLAEDGKLSVDDPLAKFLPAFEKLWVTAEKSDERITLRRATKPLTLRHLLTHTGGVPNTPIPHEGTPLSQWVAENALTPLDFEPGEKWAYSNSGINALGRVVEVVSGRPFEVFLEERLLAPLGMTETRFIPTPQQLPRVVKNYRKNLDGDGQLVEAPNAILQGGLDLPRFVIFPGGGLFSVATDIPPFYDMLLAGGTYDGKKLLSSQGVRELTRTQTGDLVTGFTEGMTFGLGFGVVRKPVGQTAALSPGSFGHGGAYGTASWADPVRQAIYVLMIQRSNLQPHGDGCDIRRVFQDTALAALEG